MNAPVAPLAMPQILIRASRALGKIDQYGARGVSMLSSDEVEAMALLLAVLGLVPTRMGEMPPETFFNPPSKDS